MESDRIAFRTWRIQDIEFAKQLWGDIEVTRYIGGPFTDRQIEERLEKEIENQKKFKVQYWPLFLKENNSFIGCCGLRPYKDDTINKEMGFHFRKEYWGIGLAFEAANRTLQYAFEELELVKVFAGHNPKNTRSKYLLLKLGFRYIRDEYYEPTGLDHPLYEMSYEDYKNMKGK